MCLLSTQLELYHLVTLLPRPPRETQDPKLVNAQRIPSTSTEYHPAFNLVEGQYVCQRRTCSQKSKGSASPAYLEHRGNIEVGADALRASSQFVQRECYTFAHTIHVPWNMPNDHAVLRPLSITPVFSHLEPSPDTLLSRSSILLAAAEIAVDCEKVVTAMQRPIKLTTTTNSIFVR